MICCSIIMARQDRAMKFINEPYNAALFIAAAEDPDMVRRRQNLQLGERGVRGGGASGLTHSAVISPR